MFNKDWSEKDIISFVYQHRITVWELLYEDLDEKTFSYVKKFLDNFDDYDGDESNAWKKILNAYCK